MIDFRSKKELIFISFMSITKEMMKRTFTKISIFILFSISLVGSLFCALHHSSLNHQHASHCIPHEAFDAELEELNDICYEACEHEDKFCCLGLYSLFQESKVMRNVPVNRSLKQSSVRCLITSLDELRKKYKLFLSSNPEIVDPSIFSIHSVCLII